MSPRYISPSTTMSTPISSWKRIHSWVARRLRSSSSSWLISLRARWARACSRYSGLGRLPTLVVRSPWAVSFTGSSRPRLDGMGRAGDQLQLLEGSLSGQEFEPAAWAHVDLARGHSGDPPGHLVRVLEPHIAGVDGPPADRLGVGPAPHQVPVRGSLNQVQSDQREGQIGYLRVVGDIAVIDVEAQAALLVHAFGHAVEGRPEDLEIARITNAGVPGHCRFVDLDPGGAFFGQRLELLVERTGQLQDEIPPALVVPSLG